VLCLTAVRLVSFLETATNLTRRASSTQTATPSVVKDICNAETGFDICLEKGLFQTGNYRSKCVCRLAPLDSDDADFSSSSTSLALLIKPTFNLQSKIALLVPFLQSRGSGGGEPSLAASRRRRPANREL
jgi:hypothetical protein